MCYFNFTTVDLPVFIHCSLRLGLVYESVATVNFKKTTKKTDSFSTFTTDDTMSNSRKSKISILENNQQYMEKYSAANDTQGNLLKSK